MPKLAKKSRQQISRKRQNWGQKRGKKLKKKNKFLSQKMFNSQGIY